jgi:hypothetical protein
MVIQLVGRAWEELWDLPKVETNDLFVITEISVQPYSIMWMSRLAKKLPGSPRDWFRERPTKWPMSYANFLTRLARVLEKIN